MTKLELTLEKKIIKYFKIKKFVKKMINKKSISLLSKNRYKKIDLFDHTLLNCLDLHSFKKFKKILSSLLPNKLTKKDRKLILNNTDILFRQSDNSFICCFIIAWAAYLNI